MEEQCEARAETAVEAVEAAATAAKGEAVAEGRVAVVEVGTGWAMGWVVEVVEGRVARVAVARVVAERCAPPGSAAG